MCKTLSIFLTLLILLGSVALVGCDGNDDEMESHSWDTAQRDQDTSTEDAEATPLWRPQPSEQQTESAIEDPAPEESSDGLQESEEYTQPRITPTPQESDVEQVPPDEPVPNETNPNVTRQNLSAEDTEPAENGEDDQDIDDNDDEADNGDVDDNDEGTEDDEEIENGDDETEEQDDDDDDEIEDEETSV